MAPEKSSVDGLHIFNSGAVSHAAAQNDPTLSLGGFRSSTLLVSVKPTLSTPSLGSCPMTIQRIDGSVSLGTGTLAAPTVDTVTWAAPGGSTGPAVTILDGQTRMVVDGTNPFHVLIITRDAATDMTSSVNVTVVQEDANAFFADVAETERAAGSVTHRAQCILNVSGASQTGIQVKLKTLGTQRTTNVGQLGASGSGTISSSAGNFADWPASGYGLIKDSGGSVREWVYFEDRTDDDLNVTAAGRGLGETTAAAGAASDTIDSVPGFELSIEAPASQPSGIFITVADEDAAPAGASWSSPLTDAEALSIGTLADGEQYMIRLRREIVAGSSNVLDESLPYNIEFQTV